MANPNIKNHITEIKSKGQDLVITGYLDTDFGLISNAQLLITNNDLDLFFIRIVDLDIDFEGEQDGYIFNYQADLNIPQIALSLFDEKLKQIQLDIDLRIEFKDSDQVYIVRIQKAADMDRRHFIPIKSFNKNNTHLFLGLNVNSSGYLELWGEQTELETAHLLKKKLDVSRLPFTSRSNQSIWLIGGLSARSKTLHAWDFFEYCKAHHPEIKVYFISHPEAFTFQKDYEEYGDSILEYASPIYYELLFQADVLLTSGPFQEFYPFHAPAFHDLLAAKKVWMPASGLGLSNHTHTFHRDWGLCPADDLLVTSELEADFAMRRLAYDRLSILLTGTSLPLILEEKDQLFEEKSTLLLLPFSQDHNIKNSGSSLLTSYLDLVQSPRFKEFVSQRALKVVIALSLEKIDQYFDDFTQQKVQVIHHNHGNLVSYFGQSQAVISNGHPMLTSFMVLERPVYLFEDQSSSQMSPIYPDRIKSGRLSRNQDDLLDYLEDQNPGNYQVTKDFLVDFSNQEVNEKILATLAKKL